MDRDAAQGRESELRCRGGGRPRRHGTCPDGGSDLSTTIGHVINILSIIAGVAAVIMIIIGGLRYIISGGDSNSTSGAKNTIIYALVGLVVAVLAQALVRFVLEQGVVIPRDDHVI